MPKSTKCKKTQARYRAKKSYLIRKKGFSETEAIAAALPILADKAESAECKSQPITVSASHRKVALHLVAEPTQEEINLEIEKLKTQDSFVEIPPFTCKRELSEASHINKNCPDIRINSKVFKTTDFFKKSIFILCFFQNIK